MESYVLWLITLDIPNNKKVDLARNYENEEEIFKNFREISRKEGIAYSKYKPLENDGVKKLREELKMGVNFITILDVEYPEILKEIKSPPYVIFYKGNIELLSRHCVAIVGGRKHSLYGEKVAKFAANEIVSGGFTLVSGGAKGIDAIAHKQAIDKKGKTIVVLGSGLNNLYPKTNKRLFDDILKNEGLLISEFFPNTSPLPINFPRRNRIISGLSTHILVAEASKRSGSLITVSYALDQGRNVGSFPTTIFSESGYGCNMLIKDGATAIYTREDLLTFLGLCYSNKIESNNIIQNEILNIIKDEPIHIDDILNAANVDRDTLYRLLFEMQIKNKIVNLPGNYYARII